MKKTLLAVGLLLLFAGTPVSADVGTVHTMDGVPAREESLNRNRDIHTFMTLGDGFKRLISYSQGYSLEVPGEFKADTMMAASQTVLESENTRIEIYRDDFSGTVHTAKSYVNYNKGFLVDPRHQVTMNYWTEHDGVPIHVMSWSRQALSRVPNDRNHYFVAEFLRSGSEVVTVVVKSQEPITLHHRILQSFRFIDPMGKAGNHRVFTADTSRLSEAVKPYYQAVFSPESPQRWGIFSYGATADLSGLKRLEQQLGYQFDVLVRYQTLETRAPIAELQRAWDDRRIVELTLQTMFNRGDNTGVVYDILNGRYDSFFRQYAQDLKAFGKPVLFRLNNEMNGDWCVYSAYHYSRDPELYKAMWRYLHALFEAEGADNLLWVWNPHDVSFPNFSWNHSYNYFPGSDTVDVVGLTGYNTGTYHPGEIWRSFDEIYPELYQDYTKTFDFPLMITEFGSNSVGGDKAAWVRDMFEKMPEYDRLKLIIWFNGIDLDAQGQPARIYRLDTDEAVQNVFREYLHRFGSRTLSDLNLTGAKKKENSWGNQSIH